MADKYLEQMVTPAVAKVQEHYFGCAIDTSGASGRDSFYMATVLETDWPYMQHRGGEAGIFARRRSIQTRVHGLQGEPPDTLHGNLSGNDRVSFLPDGLPEPYTLQVAVLKNPPYSGFESATVSTVPVFCYKRFDPASFPSEIHPFARRTHYHFIEPTPLNPLT